VKLRTWHMETAVVALALLVTNLIARRGGVEWIGAAAVLVNFGHASISDRLAEKQAAMTKPDVECDRMLVWHFLGKEVLWVAYFALHHSYSALVGCGVFILHPIWRRAHRRWQAGHACVQG
jgi:hypothetical protein